MQLLVHYACNGHSDVGGSVIFVILLMGCSPAPPCDEALDTLLRDLAGPDSTHCGTVDNGDDPRPVDECVVDAFQNEDPFRAEYKWFDIDAGGTYAWASDGATLWRVDYVLDVGEGGSRVAFAKCVEPAVYDRKQSVSGEIVVRYELSCADLGASESVVCNDE